MRLNTIAPKAGSRKVGKRVGRGIGSGLGKTCGLGHKGQRARAGGYHKVGFEGGQMPLHRRLPKFGFNSFMKRTTEEITLTELESLGVAEVDLTVLRDNQLIRKNTKRAKIILSGEISSPVTVSGLALTRGAREAIEKAGGKIVE